LNRDELDKFISAPKPHIPETTGKVAEEEVRDWHRTGLMDKLFPSASFRFVDSNTWPYGPFKSYSAQVRVIKDKSSTGEDGYVVPHIEDHDQYQVFLGEKDNPDSLTVEITLENEKFEVKSPFIAYYPKGLKHAEHILYGSGWFQTVHLAKHCTYYGEIARPCPVQIDNVYEVNIQETSRQGQGIGRINGFVIFVPGAKPGDLVKVKVKRISLLSADAEIVK